MDDDAEELTEVDPAYERLPLEGVVEAAIGSAEITMVEPSPEHLYGYNSWYENEHMFDSALMLPFLFSARRWVAPRRLQALRYPSDSPIARPLDAGKFLGVYWISKGRHREVEAWNHAAVPSFIEAGRFSYRGVGADPGEERRHIYTLTHRYLGRQSRPDSEVPDIQALSHPYAGIVLEIVRLAAADKEDVDLSPYLSETTVGPVGQSLYFAPRPLPSWAPTYVVETMPPVSSSIAILHFLDDDPENAWDALRENGSRLRDLGIGDMQFAAPFIPTVPGTTRYLDELF